MDFIQPAANDYVEQFSDATPAFLRPMYEQTKLIHPHAHLQSNWNQGGFLSFFSKLLAPQFILEIGTFTGFSTLCLAEGLNATGSIDTIELRSEDAASARAHFDASTKSHQIISHVGDAKAILPTLTKQWDLVFIDADKTGYIDYVNLVLPMLSDKGVIIATARGDALSRVSGIRAGADVYLVKPVLPEEIVSLVHNLMRRLRGQLPSMWTFDDTGWRLLAPDGRPLKLTHSEYVLIRRLAQSIGEAVTKEELATSLGHNPEHYDFRRLEILVRRLRKKAKDTWDIELPLETVHRLGYAFTANIQNHGH